MGPVASESRAPSPEGSRAAARPRRASAAFRARSVLGAVSSRRAFRAIAGCLVAVLLASPLHAEDNPDRDIVRGSIKTGHYTEAERQARALLKVTERLHGPESVEAAEVLDLIAESMRRGGRFSDPEGLRVCTRSLELKERLLPPGDPSIAVSEENLGALFLMNGDLIKARDHLERALSIRTHTLGAGHPEVARTLIYLANVELSSSREDEAQRLIERAIAIQDSALSAEDPARAEALNLLAGIHYERGEYREAGSAWERVLSLQTRALGDNHPFTASTLYNVGSLASEMGDYAEGRVYLERALAAMRRVLRPGHPLIARSLTALALNLEQSGEMRRARSLYQEALAAQRKAFGSDHAEVGWSLMRLGRIDTARGQYALARRELGQALRIQEKKLPPKHPDLAWTLDALATLDLHDGASKLALERSTRAVAIREESLGPYHPDLAPSLALAARIEASVGDTARALESALRSAHIRAEHLALTAGGLSERQALAYAAVGPTGLDVALSLVAGSATRPSPPAVRQVWDAIVRTRTLVLDEMAARHRDALADSTDPATRSANEALREMRQRLANLLVRGPDGDEPDRYHALVRRARLDMESAERDLGAQRPSQRDRAAGAAPGIDDVLAAIPPRWGIAAYATYETATGRACVAFVRGAEGEPKVVPLGDAGHFETIIRRWARQIVSSHPEAGPAAARSDADCRALGAEVRAAVWDPVRAALGDVEGVFVVPTGAMNGVNLGALPTTADRYLVESGLLLHYVTSERDLVPTSETRERGVGLLAIGGVDFGPDTPASPHAAPATEPSGPSAADAGYAGFESVRFQPLPQSRLEVEEIGRAWDDPGGVTIISGREATESAFKRLSPGKRALHLATHGFVLDPDRGGEGEADGTRGIGGLQSPVRFPPRPSFNQQSPLLLSGLALAGANRRSEATPHEEDGILTAEEVASLDLRGVEWAVLSACDTGISLSTRGEGILGLRRAFRTAGVATLIVSLWPVEDQAAREWMRAFYHARMRNGVPTAAAVRTAMLEVLRRRKAQGRSTNPFFWAAFLATGDWK